MCENQYAVKEAEPVSEERGIYSQSYFFNTHAPSAVPLRRKRTRLGRHTHRTLGLQFEVTLKQLFKDEYTQNKSLCISVEIKLNLAA